jgi:uncharacterized coiled-coil protein SlyX
LTKIIVNCPEISPEWLLTGKGQMLKGAQPVKEEETAFSFARQMVELLKAQLEEKDQQIAEKDKQITILAEALKESKNDAAAPMEGQRRVAF